MAPKHKLFCTEERIWVKHYWGREECPCYLLAGKNVGNEQQLLDKAVWEAAL